MNGQQLPKEARDTVDFPQTFISKGNEEIKRDRYTWWQHSFVLFDCTLEKEEDSDCSAGQTGVITSTRSRCLLAVGKSTYVLGNPSKTIEENITCSFPIDIFKLSSLSPKVSYSSYPRCFHFLLLLILAPRGRESEMYFLLLVGFRDRSSHVSQNLITGPSDFSAVNKTPIGEQEQGEVMDYTNIRELFFYPNQTTVYISIQH